MQDNAHKPSPNERPKARRPRAKMTPELAAYLEANPPSISYTYTETAAVYAAGYKGGKNV